MAQSAAQPTKPGHKPLLNQISYRYRAEPTPKPTTLIIITIGWHIYGQVMHLSAWRVKPKPVCLLTAAKR
jgi:hypothetical protein